MKTLGEDTKITIDDAAEAIHKLCCGAGIELEEAEKGGPVE